MDYEDIDPNTSCCPSCDTENEPMGALGTRLHYRCRHCGDQWSQRLQYASREDARLDRGQEFA